MPAHVFFLLNCTFPEQKESACSLVVKVNVGLRNFVSYHNNVFELTVKQ